MTADAFRGSALQVRVYELSQLALKFERHLDAEIVDCQVGRPHILLAQAAVWSARGLNKGKSSAGAQ